MSEPETKVGDAWEDKEKLKMDYRREGKFYWNDSYYRREDKGYWNDSYYRREEKGTGMTVTKKEKIKGIGTTVTTDEKMATGMTFLHVLARLVNSPCVHQGFSSTSQEMTKVRYSVGKSTTVQSFKDNTLLQF